MARLPQPGGDTGNWGQILNDYLGQAHEADGSLKQDVVTAKQLAPNAVDTSSLGAVGGTNGQVLVKDSSAASGMVWASAVSGTVQDATATQTGIVQLAGDLGGTAAAPTVPGLAGKLDASKVGAPNGVAALDASGKIPAAQLPTGGGAVTSVAGKTGAVVLAKADVGLSNVDNTSDVNKPISTATQTALNAKVDSSAIGAANGVAGLDASGKIPASQLPASTTPDASTTSKGIVQLAGDLSGTAAAPTVAKINGIAVSGTPAAGQVLKATSATAATWQADATGGGGGAVTSVAGKIGDVILAKTDVGLANVDNTSDLGKPISTLTQAALDAKANAGTTYTKTEVDTALAGKASTSHTHTLDSLSDVTATGATNGQSLVFNGGTWGPADVGTGGTVVDATSSVKGVVQLANDFGGTAASPIVTGLQGVGISATSPTAGQVLTYNGTNAAWAAPGAGGGTMTIVNISSNYTAQIGDYIFLNLTSGPITITTPPPTNGAYFSVKKMDGSSNNVTVVPSSGNIDGFKTEYNFPTTDRGISQDFMSNGTNWYMI